MEMRCILTNHEAYADWADDERKRRKEEPMDRFAGLPVVSTRERVREFTEPIIESNHRLSATAREQAKEIKRLNEALDRIHAKAAAVAGDPNADLEQALRDICSDAWRQRT
jgi:tellurite resistance protein